MKLGKKLIATLLTLCMVIIGYAELDIKSANAEIQSMHDWHLYLEGSDVAKMAIPKAYTVRNMIRTFESSIAMFKNPADMFVDNEDNIYVVDSGNNRIVKMNSQGEVLLIVDTINCDCEDNTFCEHTYALMLKPSDINKDTNEPMPTRTFNNPQGIYVDADHDMYIADTENSRIIHLDDKGVFVEVFKKPTDKALEDYPFDVTKISISNKGYIYILLKTDFQGFIMLNTSGEYVGNTGMTWTTTNFIQNLWSKFSKNQELVQRASLIAPSYTNFMIDDEGWVYATVANATVEKDQIRKLNSSGKNIYGGGISAQYGRNFYEITDDKDFAADHYVSNFVDIAVDKDGIIYALDNALGNIFLYDQEGNNLAFFGEIGTNRGKFNKPVAIDVLSDGSVVVLDSGTGYITVFKPTEFCNLMKEGTNLYRNAEYNEAREVWNKLLELDANYIYAHKAIGKAYYKDGDYLAAMESYKLAKDKKGYSEAFEAQKSIYTKKYFFLLVLVIVVLIVAVVFGYRKLRKYVDKLHIKVTTWGGDDE